jgi:hypothetical protein
MSIPQTLSEAYPSALQDYCRPVQPSDIALLLPHAKTFEEDAALHVPALGCRHLGQPEDGVKDADVPRARTPTPLIKSEPEDGVSSSTCVLLC